MLTNVGTVIDGLRSLVVQACSDDRCDAASARRSYQATAQQLPGVNWFVGHTQVRVIPRARWSEYAQTKHAQRSTTVATTWNKVESHMSPAPDNWILSAKVGGSLRLEYWLSSLLGARIMDPSLSTDSTTVAVKLTTQTN